MDSCFNLTRCRNRPFRVYVYPLDEHAPPSESYGKILNTLKESNYFTANPDDACLFVLSLDTLDRDPLSNFDFVRNMASRIAKLDHWNGGTTNERWNTSSDNCAHNLLSFCYFHQEINMCSFVS
jgi:glucuronyl/N-acetylglucosaminyl transferase EXT1